MKNKFSKLISEMITTASFAGWSQNPNGIGFDMPKEAAENIKRKRKRKNDLSLLFGLNRRRYAKEIGTTEDYYLKKTKALFESFNTKALFNISFKDNNKQSKVSCNNIKLAFKTLKEIIEVKLGLSRNTIECDITEFENKYYLKINGESFSGEDKTINILSLNKELIYGLKKAIENKYEL